MFIWIHDKFYEKNTFCTLKILSTLNLKHAFKRKKIKFEECWNVRWKLHYYSHSTYVCHVFWFNFKPGKNWHATSLRFHSVFACGRLETTSRLPSARPKLQENFDFPPFLIIYKRLQRKKKYPDFFQTGTSQNVILESLALTTFVTDSNKSKTWKLKFLKKSQNCIVVRKLSSFYTSWILRAFPFFSPSF